MYYNLFMKKIIGVTVVVIAALYFFPWKNINWGKFSMVPAETVTVSGEAKSIQKNQIASFSAGVMATGMDKNKAINDVNTKVNDLIKSVKDFGIDAADIKTQNLSYYQEQKGSLNPGQWQVNNTIEITLRDVAKASDLADLLVKSGANNVYGPNFRMDDTNLAEKGLYGEAMKDAKDKAEIIAIAAGRKLGKVLSVNDGGTTGNVIYPMMAKADSLGGGAPVETGTTTVYKTITVNFELE